MREQLPNNHQAVLNYFKIYNLLKSIGSGYFFIIPRVIVAWYIYKLKLTREEVNYSSFNLLPASKSSLKAKFQSCIIYLFKDFVFLFNFSLLLVLNLAVAGKIQNKKVLTLW